MECGFHYVLLTYHPVSLHISSTFPPHFLHISSLLPQPYIPTFPLCYIGKPPIAFTSSAGSAFRDIPRYATCLRLSQDFSTPVSFADSPFQGHTAFTMLRPVAPLLRFSAKTSLTLNHIG